MNLEDGVCSICGLPIHRTRRSGWVHEKQDKVEIRHLAKPKETEESVPELTE